MESLSPNLFVKDIHATLNFYRTLGFQLIMSVPGEETGKTNDLVWAMVAKGNVTIMFQTSESLGDDLPAIRREDGGSLLFYIKLKDIRSYYNELKGKVSILNGLEKTFYGATEFSIVDNNNFVLTFAEHES